MRTTNQSPMLKARAIAGTHVVVLAWDLRPGQANQKKLKGLLGFALERSELVNGAPIETYWMRAIKRFRDKDKGLPAGTPVSTAEHPIQSFQWGDYTVRAERHYRYRIVPLYGTPKLLQPDEASAVTIEVHTEPNISTPAVAAASGIHHDVFCNRGVIGAQAYAREFQNKAPNPDNPTSPEMVWLSHGLFEGLMSFIGLAKDEHFALRAAFYEFRYQPVANAFAKAVEAGVDVKIVFDAESSYKTENLETIHAAGLDALGAVIPRTVTDGIRHNKFIVLLKDDQPVAVWTGSTNISAGGIFGHSNIGHVVWDGTVGTAYHEYWKRLAANLTPTKLRVPNRAATPTPAGKPPKHSVLPLFSARDEENSLTTLQWYADRMAEAKEIVCFTVAFNIDAVFEPFITADNDVLRYIVKDDDLGSGESVGHDRDVIFAAGSFFRAHDLENFLPERDNPLNTNDYIHTKFMLVEPLSNDPLVVTGSANFSRPSQRINDENMLVIRGDTRTADIYFGEFMRVFDHHYARYVVRKLVESDKADPNAGYLKEKSEEWVPPHFDPQSYKSKRRKYFVG
jgi:phosphatidylserine/phosphatidylglycerophosphate/cardiolipin synthase-like enzyme